ncbi:MAG: NAD-dependent epimerase/dehydratase family protein [Chthonomonadales bacterium]
MRILITGNTGHIGREVTQAIAGAGHTLRTLDQAAQPRNDPWDHYPADIRSIGEVRRAAQGMDAVVHLAAVPGDRSGNPNEVFTTNVVGTWNVLLAAAEAGVERVIFFSSVNSLGNFQGHRTTLYFPIDDAYPRHPVSPYQLSKHLGEEMCRSFTLRTGMVTIALRPMFVTHPEYYAHWKDPSFYGFHRETRGKVDYWSYVDVRDVVAAVMASLTAQGLAHDAFLLAAEDTTLDIPTPDLIARHYPDVPWRVDRDAYFAENPYRSVVDCTHAREVLGWWPSHSWRQEIGG